MPKIKLPRNFVSSLNQELWIVRGHSKSPTVSSAHIQTNQLAAVVENYLVKNGMQANTNLLSAIVEASKPNLVYDDHLTELFRKERIDNIVSSRGLISQGTTIIERGRIIGPREFEILNSLKLSFRGDEAEIRASRPWLYTGYLMLVFTATMVLIAFLWLLRKDIILDSRKISLLFLMIVFTCIIFSFFCDSTRLNSMLVPLCILPLVVRAFFDTRTALFTHVLTILILGTIAPDGFDFVFMQIIAGMVSIFSIVNMRKRSQLFLAVGLIFVAYFICYLGLSILDEGSIVKVNYSNTVWLLGNCLLTLLSYPLIFFIEKFINSNYHNNEGIMKFNDIDIMSSKKKM
jgi:membrane-associated HD superfamily phosphohydrolase